MFHAIAEVVTSATACVAMMTEPQAQPPPPPRLAVGSVEEIAQVYDEIYAKVRRYDRLDGSNGAKLKYILKYARGVRGRVLDAGCGRGNALRYMLNHGIDAVGIELSSVICRKRLRDLPVVNTDIVSHASEGHRYGGVVCTDVLEHVPRSQIDKTLDAIRQMSPSAFFGIANHSSVHRGHELHVIQEGVEWWLEKIRGHFGAVAIRKPAPKDKTLARFLACERFFFMVASNE